MGHMNFWFLSMILFYWTNAFVVKCEEKPEFLLDASKKVDIEINSEKTEYTGVGTLIVATLYLQLIQNRYMFRSFTVLQCSHQHCVQPVASDMVVVRYL